MNTMYIKVHTKLANHAKSNARHKKKNRNLLEK